MTLRTHTAFLAVLLVLFVSGVAAAHAEVAAPPSVTSTDTTDTSTNTISASTDAGTESTAGIESTAGATSTAGGVSTVGGVSTAGGTSSDMATSVHNDLTPLEAMVRELKRQLQDLLAKAMTPATTSPQKVINNPMAIDPGVAAKDPLCVELHRTLSVGSRGDDVTDLQNALASDPSIYPDGSASGYFGALTKAAVVNLQDTYGLYAPGDNAASGIVGPITREFFHKRCTGEPTPKATALSREFAKSISVGAETPTSIPRGTTTAPSLPDASKALDVTKVVNFLAKPGTIAKLNPTIEQIWFQPPVRQASTSTSATATSTTASTTPLEIAAPPQAPIVTKFTGPKLLAVGQEGTWTLGSIDPSGGLPWYAVDWGDTSASPSDALWVLNNGSFMQGDVSNTLSHAYTKPGVYTFNLLVKNTGGSITRITDGVAVGVATTTQGAGNGISFTGATVPTVPEDNAHYASTTPLFTGALSCTADKCLFQFPNGVLITFTVGGLF